jgi:ERCC4-type nuclease
VFLIFSLLASFLLSLSVEKQTCSWWLQQRQQQQQPKKQGKKTENKENKEKIARKFRKVTTTNEQRLFKFFC